MGGMQLDGLDADALRTPGGLHERFGNAVQVVQREFMGCRLAGQVGQGRRPPGGPATRFGRQQGSAFPGRALLALRPAWLSCMHRPWRGLGAGAVQPVGQRGFGVIAPQAQAAGEMRPSASTAVASSVTRAAPLLSRLAQWVRCQSVAQPSRAEYWHMGATTMTWLGKVGAQPAGGAVTP